MKDNKIPSNERSRTGRGFPKHNSIAKAPRIFPVLSAILMLVNVGALAQVEVPFFLEDFEDGNATDGNPVTWEVHKPLGGVASGAVSDGSYVLTTSGIHTVLRTDVSTSSIGDVSIRAQVRRLSAPDHSIWLLGALQSDGRSYAGAISDEGLTLWWTSTSPVPNMITFKFDSSFNAFAKDINMQFDVVGTQLSLTAWPLGSPKPSSPQLTGTAPVVLPPGRVGLLTRAEQTAIRSFDAIRIGDSVLPAPTVGIQLNPGIVIHGTEGLHHRVEWRDALTPDSPWQLLEDIPSLPGATHVVYDPTPASAANNRFYRVVLVP